MKNIEELRNYFLGKDPQFKETMADNSLRLIGIEGKNFVLRTELLKRLHELRKYVDEQDTTLQNNIDAVIRDLEAEALVRQTQDGLLNQAINDEKIARQNGDATLNNKFNNYYTKAQTDLKTFTTTLTEDLTVPENEELTGLETGWYTTGNHFVYFGDNIEPVFENNAIFYFNSEHENQWFYIMPVNVVDAWNEIAILLWFDTTENVWQYAGHDIQTTISDSSTDMSVPTAAAVAKYVKNYGYGVRNYPADTAYIGALDVGVYLVPDATMLKVNTSGSPQRRYKTTGPAYLIVETNNTTSVKFTISNMPMYATGVSNKDGTVTGTSMSGGRIDDYHTYSTSEKVVGEWIDGHTLYEKTITFTINAGGSDSETIADASKIWVVEGYAHWHSASYNLFMQLGGDFPVTTIVNWPVGDDPPTATITARNNTDQGDTPMNNIEFEIVVHYTKEPD